MCIRDSADALRTFRIDRITEVQQLEGTFDVPADLDPAAVLEANLGKGWEHETHVVFDVPLPFTVVGGPELRAAVAVVAERLARSVR